MPDTAPATTAWKCAGCGTLSPDRVTSCDCPTVCLFREKANGNLEHAVKKSAYSYDSRCYDLAELFLDDAGVPSMRAAEMLAQEIQDCIESFIRNYEPTESEQGLIPIPEGYAEP